MQREWNERPGHRDREPADSSNARDVEVQGFEVPGPATEQPAADDELIIDCDRCRVRGDACRDCVVSVLLGPPPELRWDETERRAVDALADGGMVPHLRLVPVEPVEPGERTGDDRRAG